MDREGSKRRRTQEQVRQFVPSIPEVMQQYNNLSEDQQAVNHEKLATMIDASVVRAVTDYAKSGRGEEEKKDFVATLEYVTTMNVPSNVKQAVMTKAVDRAFDFDSNMTKDERNAWATVTLRAGGSDVAEARMDKLIQAREDAYGELNKLPSAVTRMHIADQLLGKMGITLKTVEDPSISKVIVKGSEVVGTVVRNNSRKVAVTGITAVTAGSILIGGNVAFAGTPTSTPGVVGGGETTSTALQMTPEVSAATLAQSPKPGVSTSINLDEKTAAIQFSGTETHSATPIKGAVAAPTAMKAQPAVAMTESSVQAKPDVAMHSVVSINTAAPEKAEAVTFAAPADTEKAATVKPALLAPDIDSLLVGQGSKTSSTSAEPTLDANGEVVIPKPTAIKMETTPAVSTVETKIIGSDGKVVEMTKAQELLAGIKTSISTGDIFTAAGMIAAHYHDKTVPATTYDAKGKPVTPVTNQQLLNTLTKDPESSVEATTLSAIHGGAHTDADYTNNILSAMSVLEAAAHDQTVLNADDVKSLIAKAVRPTDQYGGKLFDQFLQKGNSILQAKDGDGKTLLDGYSDANAKTIENLYAYVLMGQDSDSDQKAKETAMQKADEAAAAAAAAAAAKSDPSNILEAAINQAAAQFGWSDGEKTILLVAAQNGASAAGVAGLGGNVFAESGFNPAEQEGGSGIGFGYIQESYGRRTAMEDAANAAGVNVADPTWQAGYVVSESKGRGQRDDSSANEWAGLTTQTDPVAAADYWLYNSERAGIPHSETREAKASEIFNQINGQIAAIQAAQAAAAAKAAAEAAAEAAQNHMSDGRDIMNYLRANDQNGNLDPSQLATLNNPHIDYDTSGGLNSDGPGPYSLQVEAAKQISKLADAYSAQFGTNLTLAAAYRSLHYQQNQKDYWSGQGKPWKAADVGHSNHGWGLAVDITMADGPKGQAEHQWLVANAPNYGWVWPNASGEDWHFEYMGSAAQGNNTDSPEPGLG